MKRRETSQRGQTRKQTLFSCMKCIINNQQTIKIMFPFDTYSNICYYPLPYMLYYQNMLNQLSNHYQPHLVTFEKNEILIDNSKKQDHKLYHSHDPLDIDSKLSADFVHQEEIQATKNVEEEKLKSSKTQMPGSPKEQPQKYGRNICSNIFHLIIKKILNENAYDTQIAAIINREAMAITIEDFYSKLYFKQNKLQEYVSFAKIQEFYFGHHCLIEHQKAKHEEFCRIFRILTQIFLKNDHMSYIHSSNKLKQESKLSHLRESRRLLALIRGADKKYLRRK